MARAEMSLVTFGSGLAKKEHAHRVLVVEDNDATRDSLVLLLREEGFEADGTENGREALRVLREGYDACLILLDLFMPVMDGWTFRFEQRGDPALAGIPVVVLTATINPEVEARRIGAIAGMQKPVDVPALLDLTARFCPREHPS
jgi:CheY-like chemotaxis protein